MTTKTTNPLQKSRQLQLNDRQLKRLIHLKHSSTNNRMTIV